MRQAASKQPPSSTPITGTLFIIAAASGTGKTSLAKALADSMPNIKISISHTTRSIREKEQNGVHYFYVDRITFENMLKESAFLEHAQVFGNYYGTTRAFVAQQLQQGYDIILDIDWQGAQQVRQLFPSCINIFLLPPSKQVLKQRLERRGRDTQEVIERRYALASSEIAHYNEFDYLIINDCFATALQDLQAIVRAQRLRKEIQIQRHRALLEELL